MPSTLHMNEPHTWIGAAVAGNQEVVRSEEQLQVGTQNVVVGRDRLVKHLVTEHQTFTVPVRREEVRLEYEPLSEHEQMFTATAHEQQQPGETRWD
jgi:stress response protein YsnF